MEPDAYQEMALLEDTHWWFLSRRKLLQVLLKGNLTQHSQNQILEIGCGTGGNLSMLSKFGDVIGIEMNLAAQMYSELKSSPMNNIEIRSGFAPDNLPLDKKERFDAVCMFDVLEHISEEHETLIGLRDLLTVNGKLFLTVPAYQWLWSSHDDFNHHKRRYSRKTLIKALSKSGYKAIKVGYFNTFLFPPVAIIRSLERVSGRGGGAGIGSPNRFINMILKTVFDAEIPFSKRKLMPFGLSLWAVCELSNTAFENNN